MYDDDCWTYFVKDHVLMYVCQYCYYGEMCCPNPIYDENHEGVPRSKCQLRLGLNSCPAFVDERAILLEGSLVKMTGEIPFHPYCVQTRRKTHRLYILDHRRYHIEVVHQELIYIMLGTNCLRYGFTKHRNELDELIFTIRMYNLNGKIVFFTFAKKGQFIR